MPSMTNALIRNPAWQNGLDGDTSGPARGPSVSFGGPRGGNYGSMAGLGFSTQPISIGFNPYSPVDMGVYGYAPPPGQVPEVYSPPQGWSNPDGDSGYGTPGEGQSHSSQQRGDAGFGDTWGGFYNGGMVKGYDLGGYNPPGPDDGFAALDAGEYVVNAEATKKYGKKAMDAINDGKVSKSKMIKALMG